MRVSRLLASTTGAEIDFLLGADRALHGTVPTARRVAVVSADGGTGCSTIAAAVATTMAGRRSGPVLLVDAGRNGVNACARAGLTDEARARADAELAEARSHDGANGPRPPSTLAEAMTGLPRTSSGLACLDLTRDRFPGCLDLRGWAGRLAPIARFPDFIVTDFGVRDRDELDSVAASNHATCIVTGTSRSQLTCAIALADRLGEAAPTPLVCVNDVHGGASRRQLRLLTSRLARPALLVPHDPARLGSDPARSTALNQRSRNAVIRLTTALMDACQQAPTTGWSVTS